MTVLNEWVNFFKVERAPLQLFAAERDLAGLEGKGTQRVRLEERGGAGRWLRANTEILLVSALPIKCSPGRTFYLR